MPSTFGTSAYWRECAEKARAVAEGMNDREAKQGMLAIAEDYEKLAKQAEATLRTRPNS
jgi:hypothetical protein